MQRAFALLVAIAVAGCTDGGTDTSDDQVSSLVLDPADPEPVVNATPAANVAPTAGLTANVTDGEVPFDVRFDLEGDDADGDNVTWELDADGDGVADSNGTALPFNFTFTFTTVGNHTSVLNVTDGLNVTTANLTIVARAAAAIEQATEEALPEDEWAVFHPDGTCHAKHVVAIGPLYINDRDAGGDDDGVPGTGFTDGGGTWLYEESNGIEGLQLGGAGPLGGESAAYAECANPDTLVF